MENSKVLELSKVLDFIQKEYVQNDEWFVHVVECFGMCPVGSADTSGFYVPEGTTHVVGYAGTSIAADGTTDINGNLWKSARVCVIPVELCELGIRTAEDRGEIADPIVDMTVNSVENNELATVDARQVWLESMLGTDNIHKINSLFR